VIRFNANGPVFATWLYYIVSWRFKPSHEYGMGC
jgi:hypothetical protein